MYVETIWWIKFQIWNFPTLKVLELLCGCIHVGDELSEIIGDRNSKLLLCMLNLSGG